MSNKIFLKYEFENNEELYQFVSNISEFENYKLRKSFKKQLDVRGCNMKELHNKARLYYIEHPEINYKKCLNIVKDQKE